MGGSVTDTQSTAAICQLLVPADMLPASLLEARRRVIALSVSVSVWRLSCGCSCQQAVGPLPGHCASKTGLHVPVRQGSVCL